MKLTHLGHACLLVETDTARILIDPGTMSHFSEISGLDAVLVTHQHPDHVDTSRLPALLAANPGARLVTDADTSLALASPGLSSRGLPHTVANPGDRIVFGGSNVAVFGGPHAAVYGDVPGCTNNAYLVDGFFHPGDSFLVPPADVDVLAVAIDGPWLKIAESVDYVRAAGPRVAIPMHEGETTDPAKYYGMLEAFGPAGVVRRLSRGQATEL